MTDTKNAQPQSEETKPAMPAPKQRMIGNYIIGKTIGEGTFGKVKVGTHILTEEKVAIKILEKDRIVEVADVERVQREIHILKLVRHPHIIQLYEIIETPKHIFLVTEYVTGGELFDYIVKNNRLKEQEACKFFQELISGIEYLHRLRVVHRDLKPENLLLDYNKNIKIVDFGLSNTYKQSELLKTACGSPCYAAPEMIAGQKYTGLKVDIWSCGVILFASLCGYLPFEDQNTSALYKKILSGDYTLPKFLSTSACDMIKSILNTNPEQRFGIEEIRKHEWYQIYQRSYDIPPGIVVGYNRIPVDDEILSQLQKYDIKIDHAQKCLDANRHNHVTTTYHLILKRHLMNGGQSTADLNSQNFDIKLLEPKPRPQKPPISALVNHEVIKQQMREDLKERSFSTDKDKFKRSNHFQQQPGFNDRKIIQDNDTSVLRIDQGPYSVYGKSQQKTSSVFNGLDEGLHSTQISGKQYISVSPAHNQYKQTQDYRSVPRKSVEKQYSVKTDKIITNIGQNNKNRQILNPNQQHFKLRNPLYPARLQSSKMYKQDGPIELNQKKPQFEASRFLEDISANRQKLNQNILNNNGISSYDRGNIRNNANASFDINESGRNYVTTGAFSNKTKHPHRQVGISLDKRKN